MRIDIITLGIFLTYLILTLKFKKLNSLNSFCIHKILLSPFTLFH